jgi:5'-nucleotidase
MARRIMIRIWDVLAAVGGTPDTVPNDDSENGQHRDVRLPRSRQLPVRCCMSHDVWIGAVTDDGAGAPGYEHLVLELLVRGWRVDALAPNRAWTSFGTAVGSERFSAAQACPLPHLPRASMVRVSAYDLAPAAVAHVACTRATEAGAHFPRCCIIAGVNHGPNVGENLIHSGTFGAALVASWLGHAAVAVSIDDVHSTNEANPGVLQFAAAARIAVRAVDWLLSQSHPVLCNINVPNLSVAEAGTFEPTYPEKCARIASVLSTDVEALRNGHVSVSVFPTGSIRVDPDLSRAAARAIAQSYRQSQADKG